MTPTECQDLAPLYARRLVGTLDEAELDRVEAHLDGCTACPDLARGIEAALDAADVPQEDPPAAVWAALAEQLDADECPGSSPASIEQVRVSLSCVFCHARLTSDAAAYCAGCLAPHHLICFEEHGGCSAPGCNELRVVPPRLPDAVRKRGPGRSGGLWIGLGAALLAVAAFSAGEWSAQRNLADPPAPDLRAPGLSETAAGNLNGERVPGTLVSEPTYQGKPVGEWLRLLEDHDEERCVEGGGTATQWGLLGTAREKVGQRDSAIEAYEVALRQSPLDLGWLGRLHRLDPARAQRHVVSHGPRVESEEQDDDEALGDLADAYRLVGKLGEARRLYLKARDLDRSDSEWTDSLKALEAERVKPPAGD